MTIEETAQVDFISRGSSGEIWLTISDHLPWTENEGYHLELLQDKLNAYLEFIESGQLLKTKPESRGLPIIINLVAKYPLSGEAAKFLGLADRFITDAGYTLRFELVQPN